MGDNFLWLILGIMMRAFLDWRKLLLLAASICSFGATLWITLENIESPTGHLEQRDELFFLMGAGLFTLLTIWIVLDVIREHSRENDLVRQVRQGDTDTVKGVLEILRTDGRLSGPAGLLREADISEANLQYADLHDANLNRTGLEGSNLQDANLCGANLRSARLMNANLSHANLRHADLRYARLQKANLVGAHLQNTCLYGAQFDNHTTLPDGKKWSARINVLAQRLRIFEIDCQSSLTPPPRPMFREASGTAVL